MKQSLRYRIGFLLLSVVFALGLSWGIFSLCSARGGAAEGRAQDPQFSEITWHWFLLTGYEESGEGLRVVYGTYGERYTALLSSLWDTGHEQKGGILRLCIRPAHGEAAG